MQLTELAPGNRSLTSDTCAALIDTLSLTPEGIQRHPIGGIFSDGAFTPADVSLMALLTHPSQLLQIGHGGIAVVWIPLPSQLLSSPTRILHVVMPSESLHRTTPNTLELLGQIVAYKLSAHVSPHIPATSDCKSVVLSMQEAQGHRRRPFGHTAKGIFYESVALADFVLRPTRWTRSHPERRLSDRSQWSYEDKGIHIADAAADSPEAPVSEVLRHATPAIRATVQCDDILRELLADGVWHWTHTDPVNQVPILDDLMRHVNYCSLQTYTKKRDVLYREGAGLPPKWEGINPNLAYSCLSTAPTNTRQFIQTAGRIWHKSFRYGSNRVKGVLSPAIAQEVSKCPHCNRVENPSHIYASCRNPALKRMREVIFDSQIQSLCRIRTDPTCPRWQRKFFARFHRHSFSPHHDKAEKCWNGTIDPPVMQRLLGEASQTLISFAQFQQFRKRFTDFVGALSSMATQMELAQQQARARSVLSALTRPFRRVLAVQARNPARPPLHPAFRPTTTAQPPRQRLRRSSAPSTNPRTLTQTRFAMPEHGSSTNAGSTISLTTITHHEHLARTYSELNISSSGRAFCHIDTPYI